MQLSKFTIQSTILKQARKIYVWKPKGFSDKKLSVLYLLDGGLDERMKFVVDIVHRLIVSQIINPVLIIGIENIERNYDFTNHTTVRKDRKWVPKFGNANRFKRFLLDELFPFVDKNYNVNFDRTIIGESLGGLLVMDLMYHNSDQFQNYISIDPSLWWNKEELLNQLITTFDVHQLLDKKVWVSGSSTQSIRKVTFVLDKFINDKLDQSNYHYAVDDNETHFTIYQSHLEKALIWIFKK